MTGYQNKNEFSHFHPIVNFIYFALVIGFSMIAAHPAVQIITLICSVLCAVSICGVRGVFFCLKFALPVILMAAIVNPAFNHAGITILTYLPSGNPLTLESIFYGISSGCMLGTVLVWFLCFNSVMTSDKFVYLFGRFVPSLSLLLSMILRFIPKFKSQFNVVSRSQKCIGRDTENGGIFHRLKSAVKVFSITVTWALENSIETADSMKSRGYGLKGRTAYSIYKWEERDKVTAIWLLSGGFALICGYLAKCFFWRYLPIMHGADLKPLTVFLLVLYAMLCLTPVIINIREEIIWKKSRSKI